jgi:hypothetical protein
MSQRMSLTGPFGLSVAAIAIVVIALAVWLPTLFAAVFISGMGGAKPQQEVASLLDKHKEAMTTYQERFNGRSAFFRPPPKPAPPPPEVKYVPPPLPPDPGPPPIPPQYTGPSLMALMGEEAWFKPPTAGDKRMVLRVGEEKSGVTLLSTNPPWSVKVSHRGGEYTLTLFSNKTADYFAASTKLNTPIPGLTLLPVPDPPGAKTPGTAPAVEEPAVTQGPGRHRPGAGEPGRVAATPVHDAKADAAAKSGEKPARGAQPKPANDDSHADSDEADEEAEAQHANSDEDTATDEGDADADETPASHPDHPAPTTPAPAPGHTPTNAPAPAPSTPATPADHRTPLPAPK